MPRSERDLAIVSVCSRRGRCVNFLGASEACFCILLDNIVLRLADNPMLLGGARSLESGSVCIPIVVPAVPPPKKTKGHGRMKRMPSSLHDWVVQLALELLPGHAAGTFESVPPTRLGSCLQNATQVWSSPISIFDTSSRMRLTSRSLGHGGMWVPQIIQSEEATPLLHHAEHPATVTVFSSFSEAFMV